MGIFPATGGDIRGIYISGKTLTKERNWGLVLVYMNLYRNDTTHDFHT